MTWSKIRREVAVEKTPRVQQIAGIFDCAVEKKSSQRTLGVKQQTVRSMATRSFEYIPAK
jgi:hypothetical protein